MIIDTYQHFTTVFLYVYFRVVDFNTVKQYDKADIGRCRVQEQMVNDVPNPVASDAPAEIR